MSNDTSNAVAMIENDAHEAARHLPSNAKGKAFLIGAWALFLIATAITTSVLLFGYFNVDTYTRLGTWGDFVGGLLNPILTFITFLAVLLTLWLQRAELALTRDEMVRSADALEQQGSTLKKQSFENTFFQMLSLHNSILESIDLVNDETGTVTKGRDAFNVFYRRFTKIYRKVRLDGNGKYSVRNSIEVSYFVFWRDGCTELGHYFRFLFNFFRFIQNSGFEKDYYVKLIRSQLSDQELLMLFYNNLSKHGQPFQYYADRYALFDNLPVSRLLDRGHAKMANAVSFGNNPMDFRPSIPRPKPIA